MCSLVNFPPPPPLGYTTICERHANLLAGTKDEPAQCQYIQNLQYPDVNISQELLRPSMSRESARSAFLEREDTPQKRFWRAWYEHGLTGVLEELAGWNHSNASGGKWLSTAAKGVLAVVRWGNCLHGSLFPHLAMSSEDLTAAFSPNMNWRDGYIRCFAWHPHTTKFSIALRDNSVKVYTAQRPDIVPTLKHKQQKGVADLAWKPASASILAVACQSCVLIWNVEPTSLATRPSTSSAQVLSQPGHCPVTSLAWCPRSSLLISASPTDTAIMAWDVAMESCLPLRRVGGGGVSLLSWSPDGTMLLTACPSPIFRVWECKTWTCEKWTKLAGRCQAACWDPTGAVLLFATAYDPAIYNVTFPKSAEENSNLIGGSKIAVKCVDLSPVDMETEDGKVSVGGIIQNMVWDPSGERLAVQFKDGSPELIALFQTRLEPVLEVIPCGFIRGQPGEIPQLMSFQPKFSDGALLSVVWSNGRVAYIPLYFVPRCALQGNQLHQQTANNGHIQRTALYSDVQ